MEASSRSQIIAILWVGPLLPSQQKSCQERWGLKGWRPRWPGTRSEETAIPEQCVCWVTAMVSVRRHQVGGSGRYGHRGCRYVVMASQIVSSPSANPKGPRGNGGLFLLPRQPLKGTTDCKLSSLLLLLDGYMSVWRRTPRLAFWW